VVFHSLSKRSNLPGLRSGFVAGDPALLSRFLLYRTYHGSAMSVPTQLASIAAWDEDGHAAFNRELYRAKYAGVLPVLAPVLASSGPPGRSTSGPTSAATTNASRASCSRRRT
jgi:N-succinyldiaminopimelate aminotransferase